MRSPSEESSKNESEGLTARRSFSDRPEFTVLLGTVAIGYSVYWFCHPSIQGFRGGFGFLGRVLIAVFRVAGRWPVALFLGLVGAVLTVAGVVEWLQESAAAKNKG
jgi:hypothetical protein